MREHKWWLAAVGLAAAAAVLASAVSASARSTADPKSLSGDITLATELTTNRAWPVLIANFNRVYPNVHVNWTGGVASAARPALLATQFQSGNAPDILLMGAGTANPPSVLGYAAGGYLADMSKAPWRKRIPAFSKPMVTLNGKVYGWNLRVVAGPSIAYNKDIFRQLGLTVPKTFSQFLATCRAIKRKDSSLIPMLIIGGNINALAAAPFGFASSYVYAKDPNWNGKRARGKVTFESTPGWHQSVQRFFDMRDAGCFSQGVAGDQIPAVVSQFASGKAAMMWFGDTGVSLALAINSNLHIGNFPPPADTAKSTYMTLFAGDTIVINKQSKNLPAARAFVDFLAREKQNRLFGKILGEENPYDYQKALNRKIGAKALDAAHRWTAPWATTGRIKVSGQANFPTSAPTVAMGAALQGMFTGQTKSVDDVLKAADAAWPH